QHLVFQDLAVDETAREELGYGWRVESASDVLIQRCDAYRVGVAHFGVVNSDQVAIDQCFAAYAIPNQNKIPNAAYLVNNNGAQSVQFTNSSAQHLENFTGHPNYWLFATVGNGTGPTLFKNLSCTGFGGAGFYLAGNS